LALVETEQCLLLHRLQIARVDGASLPTLLALRRHFHGQRGRRRGERVLLQLADSVSHRQVVSAANTWL
jgi:hypothetical protein